MKKKGEKTIFAVLLAAFCGASLLGGCAGGVVSSVLSGGGFAGGDVPQSSRSR